MKTPGTVHFVDPQCGRDSAAGDRPESAWHSFAPLENVRLGPGDRVEILTPGRLEHSLIIHGAGSPEHPITPHFAPGRYDIHAVDAVTRRFHISNCNGEPEGDKAIAVLAEDVSHAEIIGRGAVIVCHGRMIELCVNHSQHVTVDGLGFDYARPTVSEVTVTAITGRQVGLAVHPDPQQYL